MLLICLESSQKGYRRISHRCIQQCNTSIIYMQINDEPFCVVGLSCLLAGRSVRCLQFPVPPTRWYSHCWTIHQNTQQRHVYAYMVKNQIIVSVSIGSASRSIWLHPAGGCWFSTGFLFAVRSLQYSTNFVCLCSSWLLHRAVCRIYRTSCSDSG